MGQHGWAMREIILSEVNQKEKDKHTMISLICGDVEKIKVRDTVN